MATDTTLPPYVARQQHLPIDYDDDLPPWLGERIRDTTYHIHRDAEEASHDFREPA